jgi:hypothetical protein
VVICALAGIEEEMLQSGLGQLVVDELLYQRGRPPHSRYLFKHALIQDAAYQSLLKRTRQQYHQQVAKLLEDRFPEWRARSQNWWRITTPKRTVRRRRLRTGTKPVWPRRAGR